MEQLLLALMTQDSVNLISTNGFGLTGRLSCRKIWNRDELLFQITTPNDWDIRLFWPSEVLQISFAKGEIPFIYLT